MPVPEESLPLARFLAERGPSPPAESQRAIIAQQQRQPHNLPPRLRIAVDAVDANDTAAISEMSPPDSPRSDSTSLLMSGNASLPALRRSSVGSLRSRGSRSSFSVSTPGPVDQGVPLLPLPPSGPAPEQLGNPLECPFNDLHCHERFFNFNQWQRHSLEHFKDQLPPRSSRCVFCRQVFDAPCGMDSWHDKLVCQAQHHKYEGARLEFAHPDFALHRYLWEKGCITRAEWKELGEMRTDTIRKGTRGTVMGDAGLSPPNSPRDRDSNKCDQDMVVMTTNERRDRRDRERRDREIRRLQAQLGSTED